MEKINKSKARKLYNSGKTIAVLPSKMPVNNVWMNPMFMTKENIESNPHFDGSNFDQIINSYEYYNCNNQLGKVCAYYQVIDTNN